MVLVITVSAISSFIFTAVLVLIYSIFDIRTREVPNRVMLVGAILGLAIIIQSGHIVTHAALHLSAALISLILGYTVFRIGSFGGADVKTIFTIAIISPGIEFASWGNPILEGILIVGLQLIITLLSGFLISQKKKDGTETIPLIPILFAAYLVLQLFALF